MRLLRRERGRRLLSANEMYGDHPAGVRAFLLNQVAQGLIEKRDARFASYAKEADRLYNRMVERNAKGTALERAGEVEAAVRVYEENVADGFDGQYPYERLRVLYGKRGEYEKAISVCRAFVEMADRLIALGSLRRVELAQKRARFVEWVARLEARIK